MVFTAIVKSSTILYCPARRAHTLKNSHGKKQKFHSKDSSTKPSIQLYSLKKYYAGLSKLSIWPTAAMKICGLKQLDPWFCFCYRSSSTWGVEWRTVAAVQWKVLLPWPRWKQFIKTCGSKNCQGHCQAIQYCSFRNQCNQLRSLHNYFKATMECSRQLVLA